MEIRIKTIMQEKGIRMADFCRAVETDPSSVKTMLNRESCKIATLARYAAALRVPIWEMIYDCGVSSVGRELAKWSEPNYENKIKEMMQTHNQKEVAQQMGITQSALSTLLQRGNPGLPNIEKFAQAFGIEPWELFISREDMQKEIDRRNGVWVAEEETSAECDAAEPEPSEPNAADVRTITVDESKRLTRQAIRLLLGSVTVVDDDKLEQLIDSVYAS